MKRIKNEYCEQLPTQERMTSPSLLCFEQDLVQEINFDDVVDESLMTLQTPKQENTSFTTIVNFRNTVQAN
jgi:hypothetical protein